MRLYRRPVIGLESESINAREGIKTKQNDKYIHNPK